MKVDPIFSRSPPLFLIKLRSPMYGFRFDSSRSSNEFSEEMKNFHTINKLELPLFCSSKCSSQGFSHCADEDENEKGGK